MKSTEESSDGFCSGPKRDRRNQRRIALWAFVWAVSFIAVALGLKKQWWPFEVTVAAVIGTSLLAIATAAAYRRFLRETDELRRKIEVEALALAYTVGVIGGLAYWLLAVAGALPQWGYACVFAAMMLAHSAGVLIGRRRYL